MIDFDIKLKVKFQLVKFTPSDGNEGRCIKCDGRQMCGLGSDALKCPCGMSEQLRIVSGKVI